MGTSDSARSELPHAYRRQLAKDAMAVAGHPAGEALSITGSYTPHGRSYTRTGT